MTCPYNKKSLGSLRRLSFFKILLDLGKSIRPNFVGPSDTSGYQ